MRWFCPTPPNNFDSFLQHHHVKQPISPSSIDHNRLSSMQLSTDDPLPTDHDMSGRLPAKEYKGAPGVGWPQVTTAIWKSGT